MAAPTWERVRMFLVIVVMLGILGVALAVLSHTADRGRNDNDD